MQGGIYKAFRHVETFFVQGNQVRTDQNKPHFLVIKKWLTIVNLFFYYQTRRFILISTNLIALNE